jgi:hypothetical protein
MEEFRLLVVVSFHRFVNVPVIVAGDFPHAGGGFTDWRKWLEEGVLHGVLLHGVLLHGVVLHPEQV